MAFQPGMKHSLFEVCDSGDELGNHEETEINESLRRGRLFEETFLDDDHDGDNVSSEIRKQNQRKKKHLHPRELETALAS